MDIKVLPHLCWRRTLKTNEKGLQGLIYMSTHFSVANNLGFECILKQIMHMGISIMSNIISIMLKSQR